MKALLRDYITESEFLLNTFGLTSIHIGEFDIDYMKNNPMKIVDNDVVNKTYEVDTKENNTKIQSYYYDYSRFNKLFTIVETE